MAAATGGGCTAPLLHPLHPVSLPTAQGQTLTRAANLVRATPCSLSPIRKLPFIKPHGSFVRRWSQGDPSNDNSGNPDTPTVHMSGSAFSSLWNTLSNPAHGFLPEPQSNTSGELYGECNPTMLSGSPAHRRMNGQKEALGGTSPETCWLRAGNAGGMWNPSSLPSLSLSQGGSFSLSSLSSLRGFSQLPLIPPVTGPPPSHDPSQSTTPTTAYLPGLTNAPQTNAPQELVGANAHLQVAAHMAPLRCRDCRRPISCMCPLLMRLKTHSQNHYLDAVYTVMLGQVRIRIVSYVRSPLSIQPASHVHVFRVSCLLTTWGSCAGVPVPVGASRAHAARQAAGALDTRVYYLGRVGGAHDNAAGARISGHLWPISPVDPPVTIQVRWEAAAFTFTSGQGD